MTNAVLNGYPDVVAVDVFQASGSAPGKIVVDTLPGNVGEGDFLPRITSLGLSARGQLAGWSEIKVVKRPRKYGRKIRTVFADSRWKLKDVILTENYNERDCNGVLSPDNEQTIAQLIAILSSLSGLQISVGAVPELKPLAAWRGKRANEALDELLLHAGLRMVYNPFSGAYVVSRGNSGVIPEICYTEARYRPGNAVPVRRVIVHSGPKTFEGRIDANAVIFDENNEMVAVSKPEEIFNNFPSLSGIDRDRHIQSALRLWRVEASGMVMLGRRALSVASGGSEQTYAAPRFIKPDLADSPQYVDLVQPLDEYTNPIGLSGGGKLFICRHPYVQSSGGEILTSAKILCAWYRPGGRRFENETVIRDANPQGTLDVEIDVDWIRPVESSEPGINSDEWTIVHSQVATAIAEKYKTNPQHITVSTLVNHGGIGQLGAVRYVMSIPHRFIETSLAFNFDPADSRGM
jgi:hypothetical protein